MKIRIENIIKTFFSAIVNFFHLRNYIVLEVEPGREDNTEVLLLRMLEEGWNEKYRIVVISEKPEKLDYKADNLKLIKRCHRATGGIKLFLENYFALIRAKVLINCNVQLIKLNKKTIMVYTDHGSPIKSVKAYYYCREGTDYMLIQSEFWRPICANELRISHDKLVNTGFPRNDKMIKPQIIIDKNKLFEGNFSKLVLWYPTYRQLMHWDVCNSAAIPVIHDADTAVKINDIAAKHGVMLVVKPHPAQKLDNIRELNLSNLKFIYNDFLTSHGVTSYDLLAQTDALITDYSSVFVGYLLTGNPIGLTFEDVDEYRKRPGFAIDTSLMTECSEMLYTPEDFERFFADLVSGNDPHKEKRTELMHKFDDYCDSNATDRTLRWLESVMEGK